MADNLNQYVNKVIYAGNTLIDLSTDTATASDVLSGKYFHLKTGERVQGSCTYDADTSDATAAAAQILNGYTAYVNSNKVTGSMTNRQSVTLEIDDVSDELTIPLGYHDGGGKAKLDSTEKAKIIAENIRSGVSILGVTGSMTGTEDVVAGSPTVTPTNQTQVIIPDSSASPAQNYLAQVTVNAIAYNEENNAAGGKTVTIGTAAA